MPSSNLPIVRLKKRRALPFFSQHPWVYQTAIESITGSPDLGAEVELRSHEGQFVARGLYNPFSKIRVRLYSWDEEQRLDGSLWRDRIGRALGLRERLFQGLPAHQACRLIFSEADQLSGLTVDRFGEFLVVQWTSAALAAQQEEILFILNEFLSPRGIWLSTEKGIGKLEGLDLNDGPLSGDVPDSPLVIEENGLKYTVDLRQGQKTGFYFDQRDNRMRLRDYAQGRVLDVCCYSGAFALNAAQTQCESIVAVDSSESAIELARTNAELNGVVDRIEFRVDDMFDAIADLQAEGQQFDTIVLDPPKMARTRGGLNRALKGYIRLNQAAMQILKPGGILMTCSCSGLVSREDFEQILLQTSLESGRHLQLLEQRGASPDHPVSVNCLESNYLKCFVCRI